MTSKDGNGVGRDLEDLATNDAIRCTTAAQKNVAYRNRIEVNPKHLQTPFQRPRAQTGNRSASAPPQDP
jgi:hypothetical protein